jgi:hypothetical protein
MAAPLAVDLIDCGEIKEWALVKCAEGMHNAALSAPQSELPA